MQVKICGVRRVEDARACVAARADLAGLNFVSASRREVGADAAVVRAALGSVIPVGVFADASVDTIRARAQSLGLAWIQLHGHEPPAVCAALAGLQIIKAVDYDALTDPAALRAYSPHVAAFLVDGRTPGSGQTWDLARLADVVKDGCLHGRPLFIAGGLDPQNVAAVIAASDPYGVDVASGVEARGHMDPVRVAAFCAAARRRKEAA